MGLHLASSRISLVGAGPGDPELLTLKGLRMIRSADVILYDALLSEEILDFARPGIPLLYVGKRCGKHAMSQEAISQLLVESALRHGHAVRLKGGDPFVFGRGGEEWLAAESVGIPVSVIPGVSSALAVPALAGIPLTHRGVSRGFWVLTATTKERKLSEEMEEAARSGATVVVLMGTRKVAQIAALFLQHRAADTLLALLQAGSLPESCTTVGVISETAEIIAAAENGERGVLVIGEVVNALVEQSNLNPINFHAGFSLT